MALSRLSLPACLGRLTLASRPAVTPTVPAVGYATKTSKTKQTASAKKPKKRKAATKAKKPEFLLGRAVVKPPKTALKGYNVYIRERFQKEPHQGKASEALRHISQGWHQLSPAEQGAYNQRAAAATVERQQAAKDFYHNLPVAQLELENRRRRQLNKKKGTKLPMLKFPDFPKRGRNPFSIFLAEFIRSPSNQHQFDPSRLSTAFAAAGQKWRVMPEHEKSRYQEMAKKDHARYQGELKTFLANHA
ncbi:hypothetical protein H4R34_004933 [Dimargaris verticillata]|uniref:HMG box domain-containing protein n=1 Tax=Dimargaris verticillata TaxID=2761393 RepID=A0A9W8EB78_9FUNG|nr:hypothetical protein H4R34_004933 [Dimargaris verticillata]